jgi:hypothetical protein
MTTVLDKIYQANKEPVLQARYRKILWEMIRVLGDRKKSKAIGYLSPDEIKFVQAVTHGGTEKPLEFVLNFEDGLAIPRVDLIYRQDDLYIRSTLMDYIFAIRALILDEYEYELSTVFTCCECGEDKQERIAPRTYRLGGEEVPVCFECWEQGEVAALCDNCYQYVPHRFVMADPRDEELNICKWCMKGLGK